MFEPSAARSRRRRDFRFLGWCSLALGLHGLVLGTLSQKKQSAESGGPHEAFLDAPALDFVETEAESSVSIEPPTGPDAVDSHDAEPDPPAANPTADEPTEAAALVAEQPSDPDADFALEGGTEQSTPRAGQAAPPKRLSLAQLGIGVGPRFELTPAPKPAPPRRTPTPTAQERLQQSFVQSAAKESQKLGLGVTGEVKGALLRATQSAKMSKQGSAHFVFTFAEDGKLTSATHSTLSGAAADWARVSSLVKATLNRKPTELPSGTKGARVSYAVKYSFVLPSGSKGGGLRWSLTQQFDVADIGATKQAIAKVTLQDYQVF